MPMDSFEQTLLGLWQEAGRHADASESIPVLGACLSRAIPLSGLTVQERRREATTIELVIDMLDDVLHDDPPDAMLNLDRNQLERLK